MPSIAIYSTIAPVCPAFWWGLCITMDMLVIYYLRLDPFHALHLLGSTLRGLNYISQTPLLPSFLLSLANGRYDKLETGGRRQDVVLPPHPTHQSCSVWQWLWRMASSSSVPVRSRRPWLLGCSDSGPFFCPFSPGEIVFFYSCSSLSLPLTWFSSLLVPLQPILNSFSWTLV